MRKILLAAMIAMFIMGCSKGINYSPGELELFTPDVREHIKNNEISIGMSQIAVRYAWGAPKAVKSMPEENKEIWIYTNMRIHVTKLTFVDSRLASTTSGISINNPIPEKKTKDAAADEKAEEPNKSSE